MNESFYRSIDREYDRDQYQKYVLTNFNELCIQNNYTAQYCFKTLRNDNIICTMEVRDQHGYRIYNHASSPHVRNNTKNNALIEVMSHIVSLSKGMKGGDEKRPPFEDSKSPPVYVEVNKFPE
jgi:hypothetical protein